MSTQTALYSTEPVRIRGTEWRFAIDPQTGRGAYQWRRHNVTWQPMECYPNRVLGLVTLAELDRAIYQPQRDRIQAARQACTQMRQAFELTTQQMAAQLGLRRINRLAFENGQLRFYLREAITSMAHAEVFISTREKMHQTGQELWHDLLTRMETCLNEKGERCAECGGALPVTGRNDAMGECSCVVADDCGGPARRIS